MQWVTVTDLATDVCPELQGFTEVNGPVNTPVDATPVEYFDRFTCHVKLSYMNIWHNFHVHQMYVYSIKFMYKRN